MQTFQDRLLSGKAHVEFVPGSRSENDTFIVLKIDGEYFGEFQTYTAASNHLIMLIEE